MNKEQIKTSAQGLNKQSVHVETLDGRSFTGYLNLAGEVLILTSEEYKVNLEEISSIRGV